MQDFPVYTIESAPEQSKPALQSLNAAFGMIPNIAGAMATSPVLINSLVGLFQRVHGGSFTEAQIQTLLLTNAVTNACAWAVAFHTALALQEGLDPADVGAIREGRAPRDRQHAALSMLAKTARRSGRRPIHRRRVREGSRARSDSCRCRFHHHELHRQRYKAAGRGSVPGLYLEQLMYRSTGELASIAGTRRARRLRWVRRWT
jgi:AhpD family alkylhydroperoxidase